MALVACGCCQKTLLVGQALYSDPRCARGRCPRCPGSLLPVSVKTVVARLQGERAARRGAR